MTLLVHGALSPGAPLSPLAWSSRRVQRLAREEFGGVSADERIRRLLDEHWEVAALAAVERYRREDPAGW